MHIPAIDGTHFDEETDGALMGLVVRVRPARLEDRALDRPAESIAYVVPAEDGTTDHDRGIGYLV